MIRWVAALRRERTDLVARTLERLVSSGSNLAAHEAEYLAKTCINAFCVALPLGQRGSFGAAMASIAEREARAGNALRAEAVVMALEVLAEQVAELAATLTAESEPAPEAMIREGRRQFLSAYLRSKAEEDDRRSLALETYAEVAEDVPPILYSTDEEGRITDISHLTAEQLGYRKEDLIGRHHQTLMPPEDAERFSFFIQERRTQLRATRRARVRLRAADGSEREYEVSSTGVYDEQGRYVGSDGIARAVSDSVAQLQYQLDAQGRFQQISGAAAAVLGYAPDELLGQHFAVLMDPLERERVGRMFGERRTDDRAANRLRVVLSGRDGAPRPFEISAVGQYDDEGKFTGTIGLGSALASADPADAELVEQRRRYRRVFDQVGCGLSVISADLILRDVNAWHLRRRRRKLDGAPCHLALFGLSSRCPWCKLTQALHEDRALVSEAILSPLDGRRYTLWFSPLKDDQGQQLGVVEAVIDVTELWQRHEAEAETGQQARIARLTAGLRQLLGEPLTTLALTSEAAGPLLDRLRHLFGPDSLEAGGATSCWLEPVITEALAHAASAGVDLECDLQPDCPPAPLTAEAAAELLEALLNNAVAAASPGGSVTVELGLDEPGTGLLLRVADTGGGLADGLARQAVEPFESDRPGHFGLGLSRVATLVAEAGGHLHLASSAAGGTTAEVRLPTASAAPAALPAPIAPPAGLPIAVEVGVLALAEALAVALPRLGHRLVAAPEAEVVVRLDDDRLVLEKPATGPSGAVRLRLPCGPADLQAALVRVR